MRAQTVSADMNVLVFQVRLTVQKFQEISEKFAYATSVVRSQRIYVRGQNTPSHHDHVHIFVKQVRCNQTGAVAINSTQLRNDLLPMLGNALTSICVRFLNSHFYSSTNVTGSPEGQRVYDGGSWKNSKSKFLTVTSGA